MRLENTIALINGELINSPFINNFENIVLESKSVKRGDLFIAFDEDSIEDAIFNGAYGIIFEKPTQITDSEIAWIKVKDLENALVRLLRFNLLSKNIEAYSCDEIVLKLAMQVVTETNFIALFGTTKEIFEKLQNIEENSKILFSTSITTADIFTEIKELPKHPLSSITVVEQTLFETSFIYDDIFYERQLISPFFIPYLEKLFYFFKNKKINFRLKKFTCIDHFEAVFVNNNFEIKEFGTSDKVIIFEKNSSLVIDEIIFLQNNANWAKTIYLIPFTVKNSLLSKNILFDNIFFYHSKNEIINILQAHHFHFALIAGEDKSILNRPLTRQVQLTLNF